MYRRIADDLRQKIESGELGPGSQLPTELDLREQYDASRNTIRDALRWLTTRALIETRPGQGTFVVEKIDPFVTTLTVTDTDPEGTSNSYESQVTARGRKPTSTNPRVEIQQATEMIAAALELDSGTTVLSRHQQRFIDGTPWSLQTTFYPMRFIETGAVRLLQAEDIPEGAVGYIAAKLGIRQVGYRDKIAVRSPDQTETTFFRLPDDGRVAVVELLRTGFDESGKPLRLTVNVFPADRNQFVVDIGDVPERITDPAGSDTGPADGTPARGG